MDKDVAKDIEKGKKTITVLSPKDQFELPPYDHRQEIKKITGTVYEKNKDERDYEVGGRGFEKEDGTMVHIRAVDGLRTKPADGGSRSIILTTTHPDEPESKWDGIFNEAVYDWHFHPASTATESFNPEPSEWDIRDARKSNSQFVISDSDDKVYFYNKDTKIKHPIQGGDGYGSDGSFPEKKFYDVKEGEDPVKK